MKKLLAAAVLLAALAAFAVTAAASSVAMRASMTVDPSTLYVMPSDFFPAEVAARCGPALPQGIVGGTASGEMTSEVYTGPLTATDEHCTLLVNVTNDGQLAVAHVRLGEMTLAAPGGTLEIAYEAPGVIHGPVFLGPNVHTGNGPYTITGGTGIFEGATGHGHFSGTGVFDGSVFDVNYALNGSLVVR
jgi:hypothetical protein